MCAVDEAVGVIVIMSTENDVNELPAGLLCQLVIVWLSLMRNANNNLSTLLSQAWNELLRSCRSTLVYDVWW